MSQDETALPTSVYEPITPRSDSQNASEGKQINLSDIQTLPLQPLLAHDHVEQWLDLQWHNDVSPAACSTSIPEPGVQLACHQVLALLEKSHAEPEATHNTVSLERSSEPYSSATQRPRDLMTTGPSVMQTPASARPNTSKEVHMQSAAANKKERETRQPLKSALKVLDPRSSTHHNPTGGPDPGHPELNDTIIDLTDTLGHADAVMRQAAALFRHPDNLTAEVSYELRHAQQLYTRTGQLQREAYQEFEHAAMELAECKKLMAEAQQEMAHAVAVQKAEARGQRVTVKCRGRVISCKRRRPIWVSQWRI